MFPNDMQTMQDFQAFHKWLDEQKGFDPDILFNMVLLTGEVGEVAEVMKKIHKRAYTLEKEQGSKVAKESALSEYREDLGSELADCLAYLLKLANYAGVDLQEAYLKKMEKNLDRIWWTTTTPHQ